MKCFMGEMESLFYMLLHWEGMVLDCGGLQFSKIEGGQRKLGENGGEGGSFAVHG